MTLRSGLNLRPGPQRLRQLNSPLQILPQRRDKFQTFLKVFLRRDIFMLHQARQAAVHVSMWQVRIKFERLTEIRYGRIEVTELHLGRAPPVIG